MGAIGFVDDYIKVFKKDKKGLRGIFKVIGQVGLGIIVGATLYFHPEVTIKEQLPVVQTEQFEAASGPSYGDAHKSTKTTIPFFKNNEFDYAYFTNWMGDAGKPLTAVVYILAVIFMVTAVSNGANLTDGLDGLATGTSAIAMTALLVLAYVSSSIIFASYLNIMYIPNTELVIFAAAFIGAAIDPYWYNSFPAQVFMEYWIMAIGAIIAVWPWQCVKSFCCRLSQGIPRRKSERHHPVSYFKYTKKKYGETSRIPKVTPPPLPEKATLRPKLSQDSGS